MAFIITSMDIFQVMDVEMLAKMTLTKTMCLTSMTFVRRTLTSVRQTSANSRWFPWTPKAPHRLIPTGLSAIRVKSLFRLSTVILALLLVSKTICNCSQIMWNYWFKVFRVLTWTSSLRLPWVQCSGLQWDFLHQHREGWWLCWLRVWLPVQFQVLCGDVEADYTDLLVKQTY